MTARGAAPKVEALAGEVRAGDRRALARAITLAESMRADDRARAEALLQILLPHTGKSIRLGITGSPGVGKSTFIEVFGTFLTAKGHKVAVLAVDPSSGISGGSILGDKTRMVDLARDPNAFIRPSPAGGTLGGVARRTREAMLLAEAAGFDVVMVETVGVGQSETAVADMVDMFVLLLAPGGGDDLQGIKRGIMELADLIVVTKADGDLARAARLAQTDYASALQLMRPRSAAWRPQVLSVSAMEKKGLNELWSAIAAYREAMAKAGEAARRRAEQNRAWLWREVSEGLLDELRADPKVAALLPEMEDAVGRGELAPGAAARRLLAACFGRRP
jgi:LAO/AO transport system kinase